MELVLRTSTVVEEGREESASEAFRRISRRES